MDAKPAKLWAGRFEKNTDSLVEAFNASLPFDRRLFREDIAGSIAHVKMLARQGIVAGDEAECIVVALRGILDEIQRGDFELNLSLEDIHTAIEARLREKVGPVAGKLHTARSRNDQVALDVRLFAKRATLDVVGGLLALQRALIELAQNHSLAVMPGYTHLQRAQPVLFAHHLLAYYQMFQRDVERCRDAFVRVDVLPLGSGALAGVTYPIDREFVARQLGFARISENSLDAVSDRDFVVELLSNVSLAMLHLSRFSEEIVFWSSEEFGFIELDDSYATGSSIMPQKKNPDVAELTRGKTGRVYGHLVGLLTLLKGLPLAYNKDLQEDKEALFDAVDTVLLCLAVFAPMLSTARIKEERMRTAAGQNFTLATDVADYLAKRGLPFREAHEIVGRIVRHCIGSGKALKGLTVDEYQAFSPLFAEDILNLSVDTAVSARNVPGGTSPDQVSEALGRARQVLERSYTWLTEMRQTLPLELSEAL
ncbi:MAG: argininosuccinate lyase [Chloroflexi bacterium]|nr:argininosuccinate lyase [Chloroflexota bacterium]